MSLPGNPSDETPRVLDSGNGDISTLFVSMARRHPDGADADYLRWHTLDHRPEQHRLHEVRASLRLVSTPACRAARAASRPPYDEIDHVMTYFFSAPSGLDGFLELSYALGDAGRKMLLLPPVERGVYDVRTRKAAPRVKVGADILPWWPVTGVYLILEGGPPTCGLIETDGVAGVWTATTADVDPKMASAKPAHSITYCYLDDHPETVAQRLPPHFNDENLMLAAPFHPVIPREWDRYVP